MWNKKQTTTNKQINTKSVVVARGEEELSEDVERIAVKYMMTEGD